MIRAIVGLPGSGKTYYMVRRLYGFRRRDPGCAIVTNMSSLWLPGSELGYVDDLSKALELRSCVLALDEVHLWFSARDYRSHGTEYDAWVSQLRKRQVDLWYTSQNISGVDKMLRERTDVMYVVKSWLRLGWFSFVTYDGVKEQEKKWITRGVYPFNPYIALCYDTRSEVAGVL